MTTKKALWIFLKMVFATLAARSENIFKKESTEALWIFYSTRVSSRKPAKTNKKSHSAVFVVFLLIICDNWSFMIFLSYRIQPAKQTNK